MLGPDIWRRGLSFETGRSLNLAVAQFRFFAPRGAQMAYNFRSWLLAAADMLSGCPWDKVCVISEVQRTFLERKSNTLCGGVYAKKTARSCLQRGTVSLSPPFL